MIIRTKTEKDNIMKFNNDLSERDKLNSEDKTYIEQFFVGLLEGDGTISCNLSSNKNKTIFIRIVISLNNKPENFTSNKNDLAKVFAVLAKYPLLTARKQCQLEFAKNCLLKKDIDNFLTNRNNKYNNKKLLLEFLSRKDLYFNSKNEIIKDKPKSGGNFQYYRLNLYNAESRKLLFEHFNKYPLLGYKKLSYLNFFNYHKSKTS
ncbi:hypothetical protein HOY82DRAFT_588356 [Tuber indicum]|nr:hypothetical protein HOY82DRAFT_588356 [Tuber indicum]